MPYVLLLLALAVASVVIYLRLAGNYGFDFEAFYCGARAAQTGHDPYRVEPLRTCEHTVFLARATASSFRIRCRGMQFWLSSR